MSGTKKVIYFSCPISEISVKTLENLLPRVSIGVENQVCLAFQRHLFMGFGICLLFLISESELGLILLASSKCQLSIQVVFQLLWMAIS